MAGKKLSEKMIASSGLLLVGFESPAQGGLADAELLGDLLVGPSLTTKPFGGAKIHVDSWPSRPLPSASTGFDACLGSFYEQAAFELSHGSQNRHQQLALGISGGDDLGDAHVVDPPARELIDRGQHLLQAPEEAVTPPHDENVELSSPGVSHHPIEPGARSLAATDSLVRVGAHESPSSSANEPLGLMDLEIGVLIEAADPAVGDGSNLPGHAHAPRSKTVMEVGFESARNAEGRNGHFRHTETERFWYRSSTVSSPLELHDELDGDVLASPKLRKPMPRVLKPTQSAFEVSLGEEPLAHQERQSTPQGPLNVVPGSEGVVGLPLPETSNLDEVSKDVIDTRPSEGPLHRRMGHSEPRPHPAWAHALSTTEGVRSDPKTDWLSILDGSARATGRVQDRCGFGLGQTDFEVCALKEQCHLKRGSGRRLPTSTEGDVGSQAEM